PYAEVTVAQSIRDGVAIMRVTGQRGQTTGETKALVRRLRAMSPPPGMQLLVGGGTAGALDYVDGLYERFPQAVLFIGASSFVLLLALFGSVFLALKAILMYA